MKSVHWGVTAIKKLNCMKPKRAHQQVPRVVKRVAIFWDFASYTRVFVSVSLCAMSCSVHSLCPCHTWICIAVGTPGCALSDYLASRGAGGICSPGHNWNPFKTPTSCWPVVSSLEQASLGCSGPVKAVTVSMCAESLRWCGVLRGNTF